MKSFSQKFFLTSIMVLLLGCQNYTFAQEEAEVFTAKNSVYVELLGNAGLYSVNYGRIFHQHNRLKISGSAGFSYFRQSRGGQSFGISDYWTPMLPIEITAFWGKSRHHLEAGTGISFYSSQRLTYNPDYPPTNFQEDISLEAVLPLRLGYRYQKPEGGFFFRVGYTPLFNLNLGSPHPVRFFPIYGGISLGKSF